MLKQLGLLIILLGSTLTAQADSPSLTEKSQSYFDQIEHFSYPEKLSLAQVKSIEASHWQITSTENINLGFYQDHHWFRLRLTHLTDSETLWFLRSKYPLLDVFDLYLFSDAVLMQEFHTGDTLPFDSRPINHPSFIFPLTIKNNQHYVIYIHVQTTGSLQLPLSLQAESTFWQSLWLENTTRAIFYAILFSMIFYNFFIFLIIRSQTYLYYVLYLSSFTLLMASIHGWTYQLIWPNSPRINEVSLIFFMGMLVSTAALFTSSFLRLKELRPNTNKIVMMLASLGIITSVMSFFVHYDIMIRAANVLTITVASLAIFLTLHALIYNPRREVIIFMIAWVSALAGFILFTSQKFSLLPINTLTEYGVETGGVLVALLLSLGLADRINSERKRRLETQEHMLEIQRRANKNLDKKVKERTAELEVINNQLQTASITDSLTQIKNRHYFDYKFPTEYRRAHRDQTDISLLMLDIDHFKQFNDNYGHQAGDEVLRKVAATIHNVVSRPGDTVFRYGGEEFIVLLPSTSKNGAYQIAENIRHHVANMSFQWQGATLSITISIGIASCTPDETTNKAELIKKADHFLYIAKDQGRNQVAY